MAAAVLENLPTWARRLLEDEQRAHLGLTDGDGHPRVLPVTFAVVGGDVWSAVDEKPKRVAGEELARVRWLRERPRSALTVDHYSEDWSELAWVQLLGATEIVEVEGQERVIEALAARYPAYRERTPPGPLLRLRPDGVLCWRAKD